MELVVRGPVSSYEPENLTRLFFPAVQLRAPSAAGHALAPSKSAAVGNSPSAKGDCAGTASASRRVRGDCVLIRLGARQPLGAGQAMAAAVRIDGRVWLARGRLQQPEKAEYELCRLAYQLLCRVTGRRPPWGMLTGVRPVRLIHAGWQRGETDEQVTARLRRDYDVSREKLDLALAVAHSQKPVVQSVTPRDYSLYISIPFCPSRCSYCSFVSRSIAASRELVAPYVEALCRELAAISEQARRLGLRLVTVYIGGGTPTSLDAAQLATVMRCVRDWFPLPQVREYTVEAGRPDCTDAEKLAVIKELGATRISINPQTLQDSVLQAIGRRHTAGDILRCYRQAREAGHTNINMDLIAGLPTDTLAGFDDTLQKVLALRPENITVHTLTLKRASNLVIEQQPAACGDVEAMIAHCGALDGAGYRPYYLYRQKGTLQNLENTGYALPGYEGLYNIYIMEELHSIFSAGAGGVTKLRHVGLGPDAGEKEKKIERIFNFKYPLEYIRDHDRILEKKRGVDEFYVRQMDPQTPD